VITLLNSPYSQTTVPVKTIQTLSDFYLVIIYAPHTTRFFQLLAGNQSNLATISDKNPSNKSDVMETQFICIVMKRPTEKWKNKSSDSSNTKTGTSNDGHFVDLTFDGSGLNSTEFIHHTLSSSRQCMILSNSCKTINAPLKLGKTWKNIDK
jgi:hypothetical protein